MIIKDPTITAKDGLLWRHGVVIRLPEADDVARDNGYQHAEQMVRALGGMPDERAGLPSASSMPRIAYCAGSLAAEQGLPPLPQKKVTQEGTNIHAALHTGDAEELSLSEKEITSRIKTLTASAVESWREKYGIVKIVVESKEERFWMRDDQLNRSCSAQTDFVVIGVDDDGMKHGLVLDYKSGYLDTTPSERNWQCRTQVACVSANHPDVVDFRAGIVASRLWSKLDETDYSPMDLARTIAEVRHVVWRAMQPDMPRVPGDHCRYCKASAGACRQAAAYNLVVGVDMPATIDQLGIIARVKLMSVQEKARVYQRWSLVENVFSAIESSLKVETSEALASVGLILAPGNANKEITDTKVACDRLKSIGLTDDDLYPNMKLTRGKIIDIVADRLTLTKKAATAKVEETLGDILKDKPGNPRLKEIK